MADHQESERLHQLQPHALARHEDEVRGEQKRRNADSRPSPHARGEPWQQHDQVGRDQDKHQELNPDSPGRAHKEMFLQYRRHRVRERQHRRHCGRDRCGRKLRLARCGKSNQDDLVPILVDRDLAGVNIVKRIDLERRSAVAILVEICVHQQGRIGRDLELAEPHALAKLDRDVADPQIEAPRRDHHRQRWKIVIKISNNERLGSNSAVDVFPEIEMAETNSFFAEVLDRILQGPSQ